MTIEDIGKKFQERVIQVSLPLIRAVSVLFKVGKKIFYGIRIGGHHALYV